MMKPLALLLALAAPPVAADSLVATRTIRAQAILAPSDLSYVEADIPGALDDAELAVGMETRVVLYAGRPIRPGDVGPAAIIERNQIVPLIYRGGGLTIATDARSLGRAGVGDTLRVMNLGSRNTVTGIVREDGSVAVGGPDPLIN